MSQINRPSPATALYAGLHGAEAYKSINLAINGCVATGYGLTETTLSLVMNVASRLVICRQTSRLRLFSLHQRFWAMRSRTLRINHPGMHVCFRSHRYLGGMHGLGAGTNRKNLPGSCLEPARRPVHGSAWPWRCRNVGTCGRHAVQHDKSDNPSGGRGVAVPLATVSRISSRLAGQTCFSRPSAAWRESSGTATPGWGGGSGLATGFCSMFCFCRYSSRSREAKPSAGRPSEA